MHRATTVDLAPRAKKHGACQRVQARFRSFEHPKRSVTHQYGANTQFLCGGAPRCPALGPLQCLTAVEPSELMSLHRLESVQSKSPDRGAGKVLCTRSDAHSARVTSRHADVTMLQCRCRLLFEKRLFMQIWARTGTGIQEGPATAGVTRELVHKVIHTPAP